MRSSETPAPADQPVAHEPVTSESVAKRPPANLPPAAALATAVPGRPGEKRYPNFFVHESAASRYTEARPYFHPVVIERVNRTLGLALPLEAALDVGCGTGQSSVALLSIASRVLATDPSPAMLARVPSYPGLWTAVARAEDLPVPDGSQDLISVALAFHWIKRHLFLPQAFRALKPGGHVVIYNNGFSGRMLNDPAFAHWARTRSIPSFPIPPRYRYPLKEAQVEKYGLRFVHRENYENTVRMSRDGLADYVLTQSNVIAHVELGQEGHHAVRHKLMQELEPLFVAPERDFLFGGAIWYLQKPPG